MQTSSIQIALTIPTDQCLLAAIGRMALRHAHLDYALRLTIKTLTGLRIENALEETFLKGSLKMRKSVENLARQKLQQKEHFAKLEALLARCHDASELRNRLLHGVWAQPVDGGGTKIFCEWRAEKNWRTEWIAPPSVEQVEELSRKLFSLTKELNIARRRGFIYEALRRGTD